MRFRAIPLISPLNDWDCATHLYQNDQVAYALEWSAPWYASNGDVVNNKAVVGFSPTEYRRMKAPTREEPT